MTFYRLTVHHIERDPDYEQKYAEWAREHRGRAFDYERVGEPQRDRIGVDTLQAELSEDEFKALRDAVVEQWK